MDKNILMRAKKASENFNKIQCKICQNYTPDIKNELLFSMNKFGLYTIFPVLFDDFFDLPQNINERVNTLLLTGAMYILGEDYIFDNNSGIKYFFVKDLQKFITNEINDIFNNDYVIWKKYHWIESLYKHYLYLEKITYFNNPKTYLTKAHIKLYISKHLFTRLVFDFKYFLSSKSLPNDSIYYYNKLYRFFYIYQIFDDIKDFKDDIKNKQFSYVIVKTLSKFGLNKNVIYKSFSAKDLFYLYTNSGLFEENINYIINEIDNIYIGNDNNSWNQFVDLFKCEIERVIQ